VSASHRRTGFKLFRTSSSSSVSGSRLEAFQPQHGQDAEYAARAAGAAHQVKPVGAGITRVIFHFGFMETSEDHPPS
jgi:hypothetical protein